jgi:serine/threonine-protein kinase HipA
MTQNKIQKRILVYAHWKGLVNPALMGNLHVTREKGKEMFSFEYDTTWLKSGFSHTIDPDLLFFSGPQYVKEEKINFGIFLDSCPDRWGKILMERREAALARQEKRKPKTLLQSDFLLGVYDEHRMGALRFKEDEKGSFLNDNKSMAAPPWTSLRELEQASLKFEEDNMDDAEYLKWVNMLIAPGSSLGGGRPKASVLYPKNDLWIAKFPSKNDDKDIGAWEMVVNKLAQRAGLDIAEGTVVKFSKKYHTYLTKRFDRTAKRERIHFASAMTLLGYTDGTNHESGASYLEIVEFIIKNGTQDSIDSDLEELWRRIVFSICVKNTDDHLRNHGFLLTDSGWKLSPAYDINPNEYGTGLCLNISDKDNSLDMDLAIEVVEYFRVNKKQATKIIDEIKKSVGKWRVAATSLGISKSEQDRMSKAFE